MESSTLNRMASFDFQTPIDVVYFVEDNYGDQIDLTSSPDSSDKGENIIIDKEVVKDNTKNAIQKNQTSKVKKITKTDNITNKRKKIESDTANTENMKSNKAMANNVPIEIDNDGYENSHDAVSAGLKAISNYLTLILESYQYHLCILKNKKSTMHDMSASKNNFMAVKNHCFSAVFKYVNSYILPNENNQQYIHIFLNYTKDVANKRMNLDCHNAVTELYFEMMKWVKQKKYKDFTNTSNTHALKEALNKPPITSTDARSETLMGSYQHQPYSANPDQDKLCIFSSGPIDSEISISVDKSLVLNKNQTLYNNFQLPPNNVVIQPNRQILQNDTLPNNGFAHKNILFPDHLNINYQHENNFHPSGPVNTYLNVADNRLPKYQPKPNNLINLLENNNSYYNYYHTTKPYQNSNYNAANNNRSANAQIVPNMNTAGTIIDTRNNPPRHYVGDRPPYRPPVHPNQRLVQVTTIHPGMSSGPDLSRSSVSTDSGFVTPVASTSDINIMKDFMNDAFELEHRAPSRPQVPRVAPVCHVCRGAAMRMCSACYKTNYCNTKCQRFDWDAHKLICQKGTGNQL